jgi:TatD DNase family protein
VAVDAESSEQAVQLANAPHAPDASSVWASVGIHPNYAHQEQVEDWSKILSLTGATRVCALGETGLDRYWDDCPFDLQRENFARHWRASRETQLPVIVHSRDCDREMLEALRGEFAHGPLRGVMHSFAGSAELAHASIAMGLHISFSGILTYKKSHALRALAKELPLEQILLETDCPYLSPDPVRSVRPNEPALIVHTAKLLAEIRGMPISELAHATTENSLRLFSKMS